MNYLKITESKKKTSELLDECRARFPIWSYYDDAKLDADFPPPKEITTRYFKDTVETDEQYANMSADDLAEKKIDGITLRERILAELQYFKETGKHLDIQNVTLCAGSRYAVGFVPGAYWFGGKFRVYWYDSSDRHPSLRVRESLSVDPSPSSDLNPSDIEARLTHVEKVLEHYNLHAT